MNNMEFEEPEFEMEDGMGYGMGAMGMGAMGMGGAANMGMNGMAMRGAGMGMNGMAMSGANMGMSGAGMGMGAAGMGMGAGMGAGAFVAPGATVVRHITTGVVPGSAIISPSGAVVSTGGSGMMTPSGAVISPNGAVVSPNGAMVSPASSVQQTVVPVTGVRYKLKPYTYKYTYPVWHPSTKMAFTQTPYNNPCAGGCSSRNPHCCHKEVTYVPKTVPKVIEETVSVPVEVDVPNVSCGCHASRPHCCGGNRRPVSSGSSSGCSCHASAPHCCRLSSPKWAYARPSRNQHYGAVGYPF